MRVVKQKEAIRHSRCVRLLNDAVAVHGPNDFTHIGNVIAWGNGEFSFSAREIWGYENKYALYDKSHFNVYPDNS